MIGDGNDEFLLALFGPLDRDDKDESIPVRNHSVQAMNLY